jgi:formylmethanofuran dehydrogenase subunit E
MADKIYIMVSIGFIITIGILTCIVLELHDIKKDAINIKQVVYMSKRILCCSYCGSRTKHQKLSKITDRYVCHRCYNYLNMQDSNR